MHQAFASAFDDLDPKGISLVDLVNDVQPFSNLPKTRVVPVQVGGVFTAMHKEKLRSPGVASSMRHAEHPFVVVLIFSIQLTVDGVARPPASNALGTTSLGNKPGDDTMEFQAFVEALLGKFDKVGHRLGGIFLEKLHGHGALVSVNFRVHGTKMHHSHNMGKPLRVTMVHVKQMEMNRLRWARQCLRRIASQCPFGQQL